MNLYTNLRKHPFVHILSPFVIGILFARAFSVQLSNLHYFLVISVLIVLGLLYSLFAKLELKLADFFVPVVVFVLSILHCTLNNNDLKEQKESVYIVGRVLAPPIEKSNSYLIKVKQIYPFATKIRQPRILLYTSKGSASVVNVEAGSLLNFSGELKQIKNRGNPDEFDYALYQATKGYYFFCYVPFPNISISKRTDISSRFLSIMGSIRSEARDIIHANISSEPARGILQALVLGDKSELDQDLRSKFADAGVVHVLAISGLHIGILYIFLSFILKPFQFRKNLRVARIILIVMCIWFYAGLTGFSSSVSRAALMFTLVAVGNGLKREVSIYNIIAASAFIILVINPWLLFDVGFQLSYLAVIGIVYFYPMLYSVFRVKHWALDYFNKLVCVSFAAQISTLPLTLYYFNQFPTYFWMANLVVIPVVFVLLFLGIFLLACSKIAIVSKVIGVGAGFLISVMQNWIELIAQMPFSTIRGLHVHFLQAIMLLVMIYLLFTWLKTKKPLYLISVLSSIALLLIVSLFVEINTNKVKQLVFYNTFMGNNIGCYNNNGPVLLSDLQEKDQESQIKSYFEKHWQNTLRSSDVEYRYIFDACQSNNRPVSHLIHVNDDLSILFANSDFRSIPEQLVSAAEYIYIAKGIYPPNMNTLKGTIVLSSALGTFTAAKWIKFAHSNNLDLHNLDEEGALIVNLH